MAARDIVIESSCPEEIRNKDRTDFYTYLRRQEFGNFMFREMERILAEKNKTKEKGKRR